MSEHTEGPWKLIMHGDEQYPYPMSIHTEDDACWIARDGTVAKMADARLIAAAPEMLDALKKLTTEMIGIAGFAPEIRALVGNTNWAVLGQRVQEAHAAISRAEGRHP